MELSADFETSLAALRRRDLEEAVSATRTRMLQLKRCPTCTLRPPCAHFPHGLPTIRPRRLAGPRYRSVNCESRPRERSDTASNRLSGSLRKRVKLLQRLDKYREDRLKRQIEQLENEERAEEQRRAEEAQKELSRLRRQRRIKALLSAHAHSNCERSAMPRLLLTQTPLKPSPRPSKLSPARLRELVSERVEAALRTSLSRVAD